MGLLSTDNYKPILKSLIHLINKKVDKSEIPKPASDEELLNAMIETDMLSAVTSGDAILTDETGKIILW